jgi:hypothetical protein
MHCIYNKSMKLYKKFGSRPNPSQCLMAGSWVDRDTEEIKYEDSSNKGLEQYSLQLSQNARRERSRQTNQNRLQEGSQETAIRQGVQIMRFDINGIGYPMSIPFLMYRIYISGDRNSEVQWLNNILDGRKGCLNPTEMEWMGRQFKLTSCGPQSDGNGSNEINWIDSPLLVKADARIERRSVGVQQQKRVALLSIRSQKWSGRINRICEMVNQTILTSNKNHCQRPARRSSQSPARAV